MTKDQSIGAHEEVAESTSVEDDQMIESEEQAPGAGQGAAEEDEAGRDVQPVPQAHPEARRVRALPRPTTPTRAQREEHELTHIPYASWCRHCVKARAMNDPHRRTKKHVTDRDVPIVSGDFCFMGQSEQEKASPIFVLRDHSTRMTFAHMVEGKSTVQQEYSRYLRSAVLKDINGMGHKKMVFKFDGEPACKALQEQVREGRDAITILENSPVDESQSNGVVEKAIQEVEGMVRTLKNALEERLRWRIEPDHPVLTWLVEWAATLINLYRVGKDGKTPVQRHKGDDRRHRAIAEFDEAIWYMPLSSNDAKLNKMDVKLHDGVWLGMDGRDGSVGVRTASGVVMARTIRRKPIDSRWSRDEVERRSGTPRGIQPQE